MGNTKYQIPKHEMPRMTGSFETFHKLFFTFYYYCGGGSVFHGSSINLFLCSDSYWTEILSRYWTKYMAPYKHYPSIYLQIEPWLWLCWWWWQADMSKYPVSREVLISQRSFGSRVRPFIFIGSPEGRQYPSLYLTTSSISVPPTGGHQICH